MYNLLHRSIQRLPVAQQSNKILKVMAILSTLKVQYYISRNLSPHKCVWVWFGQISLTTSEVSSYFDSHFTPIRLVHRNLDGSSFFFPPAKPRPLQTSEKSQHKDTNTERDKSCSVCGRTVCLQLYLSSPVTRWAFKQHILHDALPTQYEYWNTTQDSWKLTVHSCVRVWSMTGIHATSHEIHVYIFHI